jgi:hypothetical protein
MMQMEASEEYFVLDSSSSSDHETSRGSTKRKRDDGEEELGDRLSEENLSSQMKVHTSVIYKKNLSIHNLNNLSLFSTRK